MPDFSSDQAFDVKSLRNPTHLLQLAKASGIETMPLDVISVATKLLGLRLQFKPLGESISGCLKLIDDRWTVYINSDDHPKRQRFTLAHEIAHFILHKDKKGYDFVDNEFFRSSSSQNRIEQEANNFAGAILIPKDELKRLVVDKNIRELDTLSDFFDTSAIAVKVRSDVISRGYYEF
jgi:Zn-dependent peptidase ImmA (M78 family)